MIVDAMMSKGDIPNAGREELKAFARSRCNIVLNALGYKSIFDETGDTISAWFYSSMNSFKLNDNFYTRGRNYKREFSPKDFDIFTDKQYEEVLENIKDVIKLLLEEMNEAGNKLPETQNISFTTVEVAI